MNGLRLGRQCAPIRPKPYHPKMIIRQRSSNGRAVRSAFTVEQDTRAWELRMASLTYAQIGTEARHRRIDGLRVGDARRGADTH